MLYMFSLSFKSNMPLIIYIAFNSLAAFLHKMSTCLLNLSLSSIVIPNNFNSLLHEINVLLQILISFLYL